MYNKPDTRHNFNVNLIKANYALCFLPQNPRLPSSKLNVNWNTCKMLSLVSAQKLSPQIPEFILSFFLLLLLPSLLVCPVHNNENLISHKELFSKDTRCINMHMEIIL